MKDECEVLNWRDLFPPSPPAARTLPRHLSIRVDVLAIVPDDRFLSRDLADRLENTIRQEWFRDGCYKSGRVEWYPRSPGGEMTVRLTFKNRHGPNWFWRWWNHFRRVV